MTNNTPDYNDNLYFEEKKMDCKNCPYTDEYCASGDCETVNKLLDDNNKRLKHDVGNLGYKIKNQRKEIERQIAQNKELKDEIRFLFDREEILLKKLNIALMCVRDYAKRSEWGTTELGESCYFGTNGYELAEEALAKIKEVGTINEVKFKPFSERLLEEKLSENKKLKELLKECKDIMNKAGFIFTKIADVEKAKDLIKKIGEVLK